MQQRIGAPAGHPVAGSDGDAEGAAGQEQREEALGPLDPARGGGGEQHAGGEEAEKPGGENQAAVGVDRPPGRERAPYDDEPEQHRRVAQPGRIGRRARQHEADGAEPGEAFERRGAARGQCEQRREHKQRRAQPRLARRRGPASLPIR